MGSTSNWLLHDHERYDEALAKCQEVADEGHWDCALKIYQQFVDELKLHMRMEDEVLYPFYEDQYGDPEGEIAYLYTEHDNIARLLHDLAFVIERKDFEHFRDSLKPLQKALNLHNENEEPLFLAMEDHSILKQRDEIIKRMNAMQDEMGMHIWNI